MGVLKLTMVLLNITRNMRVNEFDIWALDTVEEQDSWPRKYAYPVPVSSGAAGFLRHKGNRRRRP